ncbi:MAG: hypothetical protein JOY92_03505 [Verrucomicrobia bacterium]|nr:hypothetical protein [Verrucomicrobiota bacterium]
MPNPLFYASTFHTLLGCIGQFLGTALTIRVFALLLLVVQFCHIERAAKQTGVSRFVAIVVATVVSWQGYQMVNLYERSDLTEFTALACLTCSLSCLFVLCLRVAKGERDPYGLIATGVFYGLAALTHPLTGLFGGILLVALGLSALLVLKSGRFLLFGVLNSLALSCLLSPWLYVVLQFGKVIHVADPTANAYGFREVYVASTLGRALTSALSPISGPFNNGLDPSGYPVINVQISLALLVYSILTLAVLRRCSRRCARPEVLLGTFLGLSYVVFVISLLVFCVPKCSTLFGSLFDIMQFSYRLAAYVNLALMLCLLCMFGLIDQAKLRSQGWIATVWKWAAIGAFVLAAIGLCSKTIVIESSSHFGPGTQSIGDFLRMMHSAIRADGYWSPGSPAVDTVHLNELPVTFDCASDYDVPSAFATNHSELNGLPAYGAFFQPGTTFGEVNPIKVSLANPTLLITNVTPFPWNAIYLDEKRLPCSKLFPVPDTPGLPRPSSMVLALRAEPGRHVLRYEFRPEWLWLYLRGLSWLVLVAWTASWVGVIANSLLARKPATSPAESSVVPNPVRATVV